MANTYIYQMTDTWNSLASDYVGIGLDVTDTSSTSNSALMNLSVGGANQFTVFKSGDVFATGGLAANAINTLKLADGIIVDYSAAASMGRIMVGLGDGFTFYSGNSTAVGANVVMMTISNTGVAQLGNSSANVQLGGTTVLGTPAVAVGYGNSNSSVDIVVTNSNTGGNTSADFAAYDGSGLSGVNFIDMGINGNTWSNSSWTINGPSDGYLYTGNTNLSIGTAGGAVTNGYINFFTAGTLAANERMRITPGGNVGIGNTAPDATFKVTGTANISGNVVLSSNSLLLGTGGTAAAQSANGWTMLPNGMKANYGWIAANSSVANATFTSPFTTACLHVFLTSVSATATGPYLIQPANTTVAPIRTTSATAANVAYYAIGY